METVKNSISELFSLSEILLYAGLFLGFTVLALLTKGRDAVKWTPELRKSGLINLILMKFNHIVGGVFLVLLFPITAGYEALHLPQISAEFWAQYPTVLVWLGLLFVYDISLYWAHRFLHSPWLWPIHAIHHSERDMHFMTWSRAHVIEQVFIYGFILIATTWLGLPIEEIFILAFIKGVHQYYVHSNLDWNHGPFHLLLVSPNFHRWHHADVEAAYDKNFASIFPFLDKIFGSYYNPGSAKNVPTGFENNPENDFAVLLFYPFREWRRMIKDRLSRRQSV